MDVLRIEILAIARSLATTFPDTAVYYLDAGFPFGGSFPLLPHLSHGDGRNIDLALYFVDEFQRPIARGGSPIGYWGYVPLPAGSLPACQTKWLDLRWDLSFLQPLLGNLSLDATRTGALVRLAAHRPKIGKVLIEPHVRYRLGVVSSKVKFQGCDTARHDDHMHIQLR